MSLESQHTYPGAAGPHAPPNPLLLLHRYLRGRYWFIVPLAAIFAIPGAIGGYMATKPKYESIGRVQVLPAVDLLVGGDNSGSDVMPFYDSFLNSQVILARDSRVLSRALEIEDDSGARIAQGWPLGMEGERLLARSMTVTNQRGTSLINISVSHSDPAMAKSGATAMTEAYMDIYGQQAAQNDQERKEELETYLLKLQSDLIAIDARIKKVIKDGGFPSEDIALLRDQYVERVLDREDSLESIDADLEQLRAFENARNDNPDNQAFVRTDDSVLASVNGDFADILARLRQERANRDRLRSMGVSELHRDMRQALDVISDLETQLDRMRPEVQAQFDAQSAGGADPVGSRIVELERSKEFEQRSLQDTRIKLQAVEEAIAEIQRLRNEAQPKRDQFEEARRDLAEVSANLERLKRRISVAADPRLPLVPSKDRRIPLAAAGAMGGAGIVVLLFAGVGFLDHRLRFVDQIEESNLAAPLLGVLPTLTAKREDQAHLAAESVHHLRNMLEVQLDAIKPTVARMLRGRMPCRHCGGELQGLSIRQSCPGCGQPVSDTIRATVDDASANPKNPGRSVVITSAGAGDGKTSVTAALGMSFAATGRRTVVVDADLVGRGLTDSLGLSKAAGLSELEAGAPLNGELHATDIANLWALPAGRDDAMRPEQMGSEFASKLVQELEERFDVVLVDTGPLLGSLEANLVTSNADGALLVVSKGQDGKQVQTTLRRIAELNARCLGIVYNRATATDISRSASAMSGSRSTRSSEPSGPDRSAGRALITVMDSNRRHSKSDA